MSREPKAKSETKTPGRVADLFQGIRERYPSFIPRKSASEATGNLYCKNYLSNLDCQNRGPRERFRVGGQVVYSTESFIEWLLERVEPF